MTDRKHLLHVRYFEGDDHLHIELTIGEEQKTFKRPVNEAMHRLRSRIQLFAQSQKSIKHGSESNTDPDSDNSVQSTPDISVVFEKECGERIEDDEAPIRATLSNTARVRIDDQYYDVVHNEPRVRLLSVLLPIMIDIPTVPVLQTEFCRFAECRWKWYREEKGDDGEVISCLISELARYVPTAEDEGSQLQLKCMPPNDNRNGSNDIVLTFTTPSVISGPDRRIFRDRIENVSSVIEAHDCRVMSYNILFSEYTDKLRFKEFVFKYVDSSVLDEHYRIQLILTEIEENNPDILCLQEIGESIFRGIFEPILEALGYEGIYSGKTGLAREGCATFSRRTKYAIEKVVKLSLASAVCNEKNLQIRKIFKQYPEIQTIVSRSPSIAQILVLQCQEDQTRPHSPKNRLLIVSNTHLFYRDDAYMCRLIQLIPLIRQIEQLEREMHDHHTIGIIMAGDYNALPSTAPVDFLLNGSISSKHPNWKDAYTFRCKSTNRPNSLPCKKKSTHGAPISEICHSLNLTSACGIPEFTNYVKHFNGTLDYIFINQSQLRVVRSFPMFTRDQVVSETALPSSIFPSDHVSLVADLAFMGLVA